MLYYIIAGTRFLALIILSILLYKQSRNIYLRRHHLNGIQPTRLTLLLLTASMWLERLYRIIGNIIDLSHPEINYYMDYLGETQWLLWAIQLFTLYATYQFYKLVGNNDEKNHSDEHGKN